MDGGGVDDEAEHPGPGGQLRPRSAVGVGRGQAEVGRRAAARRRPRAVEEGPGGRHRAAVVAGGVEDHRGEVEEHPGEQRGQVGAAGRRAATARSPRPRGRPATSSWSASGPGCRAGRGRPSRRRGSGRPAVTQAVDQVGRAERGDVDAVEGGAGRASPTTRASASSSPSRRALRSTAAAAASQSARSWASSGSARASVPCSGSSSSGSSSPPSTSVMQRPRCRTGHGQTLGAPSDSGHRV